MRSQTLSVILAATVSCGGLLYPTAAPASDDTEQVIAKREKKLHDQVTRRLGNRQDNSFLVALAETTHHHVAHIDDVPTEHPGALVDRTVMAGDDFLPITTVTFEVIEGRDNALKRIMDHMEPFISQPKPDRTRTRRSGRRDRQSIPPEPAATGDWRVLGKHRDFDRLRKKLIIVQAEYDATPRWKAGPGNDQPRAPEPPWQRQ